MGGPASTTVFALRPQVADLGPWGGLHDVGKGVGEGSFEKGSTGILLFWGLLDIIF